MDRLIPELLCPVCLRYFGQYTAFPFFMEEKQVKRKMKAHVRTCSLPFSNCVYRRRRLEVFSVLPEPSWPRKERSYVYHVAYTMWKSREVMGDCIGWELRMTRQHLEDYYPRAFVPVRDGLTAGILLVSRRQSLKGDILRDKPKVLSKRLTSRWCLDKIWVHEPYRRLGVATEMIGGAANSLEVDVTDLSFLAPVSEEGLALVRSLGMKYVSA